MIYMEAGGYEATFGQTFYHFAGTAKVDAISASSFGFSLGAGLLAGRFSLDIAWIYFRPKYTATTNVLYQYGYTDLIRNSETENDGFLKITLGVSIY
jgi:hypothetical protein